jgi:ribonucleotide monophosphatase NagD (HAD superfamily)
LQLSGRDIVVVGDHVEADVAFGRRMGASTVLVLTGCALPWERQAILASKHPPTVILESVADLPAWLREAA